jgi:hypothetical protein
MIVGMDDRSLSSDEAALVLRRAAELSGPVELGSPGLDRAALEEAAAEVGIEPAAVRRALAELDAGVLAPADGPRLISVRRAIERPFNQVDTDLRLLLRRELFQIRRDTGARSLWVRREALAAQAIRLANRFTGHLRMTAVRGVDAHVVTIDESTTLVQLHINTRAYRRWETAGMAGSAAAGASGAAAGVSVLGVHPLGLAAAGGAAVIGALGCAGAAAAYRGRIADVEAAAEGVLDELAKGSPLPPRPRRRVYGPVF